MILNKLIKDNDNKSYISVTGFDCQLMRLYQLVRYSGEFESSSQGDLI